MRMTTYYYLTAYNDEVIPCEPTPEGWAKWLAAGDPDWDAAPASPGDTFRASSLTLVGHVRLERDEDGRWRLPANAPAGDFAALVSGPGVVTWWAEDIVHIDDLGGPLDGIDHLASDDGPWLVIGRTSKEDLVAIFHGADQPLTFVEVH